MEIEGRIRKLMALGDDPPHDLEVVISDLSSELKRRGVSAIAFSGIEIALKIAFALGEKNAALKIAREEADE